jgi:hypothetical protein
MEEIWTFNRLFTLIRIGVPLFTICAEPSTNGGAPDHPTKPAEKRVEVQALPAPGTYAIDPDHAFAYFGARHRVVGLVCGSGICGIYKAHTVAMLVDESRLQSTVLRTLAIHTE